MSISSDTSITRQKALEMVYDTLIGTQKSLITKAVNGMSNSELASELHNDMYFYHVEGKGKLKPEWEVELDRHDHVFGQVKELLSYDEDNLKLSHIIRKSKRNNYLDKLEPILLAMKISLNSELGDVVFDELKEKLIKKIHEV